MYSYSTLAIVSDPPNVKNSQGQFTTQILGDSPFADPQAPLPLDILKDLLLGIAYGIPFGECFNPPPPLGIPREVLWGSLRGFPLGIHKEIPFNVVKDSALGNPKGYSFRVP